LSGNVCFGFLKEELMCVQSVCNLFENLSWSYKFWNWLCLC